MSIANLEFTLRKYLTMPELEAGLDDIRRAPKDEGVLELIVRRPAINDREILEEAELHLVEGLVGDSWKRRRSTAGTRLSLGSAAIEVTPPPHLGCQKFVARFGRDAMKFVNSPIGRQLHLRGVNGRVIQGGIIRVGDVARKI